MKQGAGRPLLDSSELRRTLACPARVGVAQALSPTGIACLASSGRRNVVEADVRQHSRQPDEFFELVDDQLCPGSTVELLSAKSESAGKPLEMIQRFRFTWLTTTLVQFIAVVQCDRRVRSHSQRDIPLPIEYFLACALLYQCYRRICRSRKAFVMTDTELNVIAALAIIGLRRIPKNG